MSGAAFTVAAFVFAALFAMATGSGFGTISTMSFILYPAGILLGSNPAVLAGAILSGAAVGDNLAPVSDTTIIAATSQEYNNKEGAADIGGTVRTRSPLVIVGFVVAPFCSLSSAVLAVLPSIPIMLRSCSLPIRCPPVCFC